MITENVGYNRNTLLEMLKNRIVEVRFRKATGESRTLRGTLLDEYLNTLVHPPVIETVSGAGYRVTSSTRS